jgi:hypothetical protein
LTHCRGLLVQAPGRLIVAEGAKILDDVVVVALALRYAARRPGPADALNASWEFMPHG